MAAQLLKLYHGTDGQNAESILHRGLRASAHGRLGPGVYFTDDKAVAKKVAQHRGLPFVVTASVRIGKVIDYAEKPTNADWHPAYDTAMAIHPAWCGAPKFREFCVFDVQRVRIVHVEGTVALPQSRNIMSGKDFQMQQQRQMQQIPPGFDRKAWKFLKEMYEYHGFDPDNLPKHSF